MMICQISKKKKKKTKNKADKKCVRCMHLCVTGS